MLLLLIEPPSVFSFLDLPIWAWTWPRTKSK